MKLSIPLASSPSPDRSTLAVTLLGIETRHDQTLATQRVRSTLAVTLLGIETSQKDDRGAFARRSTLAVTLLGIETHALTGFIEKIEMFNFGCNPFRD